MAENLLTVAALRTTMEAELIRSKLEGAGISAVLVEPEKGADGAPAGRIQVQVGPPDFEKAMQLLFPIPTIKRPAKETKPPWKCANCGEYVLAQFPVCWKCGTSREGQPTAAIVQPLPGGTVPSLAMPTAGAVVPPMPKPPAPTTANAAPPQPTAPLPPPAVLQPASAAPKPVQVPKPAAATAAGASTEELKIPPIPMLPPSPTVATRPSANGESAVPVILPPRIPRTAEDEALTIVVPPWDPSKGKRKSAEAQAADDQAAKIAANDRAARRAWYAALVGICPPFLIYSIWVVLVLGITNRPLSRRGHRFFYGALAVNALLIAAFFAWFGRQR